MLIIKTQDNEILFGVTHIYASGNKVFGMLGHTPHCLIIRPNAELAQKTLGAAYNLICRQSVQGNDIILEFEKMEEPKEKQNVNCIHNKLVEIADHYGLTNQLDKTVEETAELIDAIAETDTEILSQEARAHIIEEMADVSIMIEQLIYLLKAQKEFDTIREKKVDRQIKRIEKEIDQANTNAGCKLINNDLEFSFDIDCNKSVFVDLTKALANARLGGKQ